MIKRIREKLSVITAKRPSMVVLLAILGFNIVFFLFSALLISNFALTGTEKMPFISAAYATITMILDAGCIDNVVKDIGESNVGIAIFCLMIIVIGMISFTGAVIGYITNYISNFVDNSNSGGRRLHVSGHTVILNWNSRASEIVNDLLYCGEKQTVVVLVENRREDIKKEVHERLTDTVVRENQALYKENAKYPLVKRYFYNLTKRFKMTVSVIVREGDVFSSKQLRDICLEHAKSIIILGDDINNTYCKYEQKEVSIDRTKGNPQTIKSLMQVADITSSDYSDNDQKIVVEVSDDWTSKIVDKIIKYKQTGHETKCNIVPVEVNNILGQLLSQFSIMPELNHAYKELFSNKGATFQPVEIKAADRKEDVDFIRNYLSNHRHAIPLTSMADKNVIKGKVEKSYCYYSTNSIKSINRTDNVQDTGFKVDYNADYTMERKNVVILGHNSKCEYIMKGFKSFISEWPGILHIMVIDDEKHLEKLNYYSEYSFVDKIVVADIYDDATIIQSIDEFASANAEDTSILILSDDEALNENLDANALSNLICIQELIENKCEADPNFDRESIDVVVELIDPKHHDIVNNYSVNNVIISNRYISKMITQIGEKDALFDFYTDILSYDEEESETFESKEVYAKKVSRFFNTLPGKCTAGEIIRAVFEASSDSSLPPEKINPTLVLGYVKPGGEVVLFEGDQNSEIVELGLRDKLIVFSSH